MLSNWLSWVWAARQDVIVLLALVLWAYGCWQVRAVACGVPALVILWYALPSRPPFIVSDAKDEHK